MPRTQPLRSSGGEDKLARPYASDGRAPSCAAEVNRLKRIAFIGNALPRHCGIATFTTDLQSAVSGAYADLHTSIVAMTDDGQTYDYPGEVGLQIHENALQDYRLAADFLNAGRFDVVCLQHEFGIFGGAAGGNLLLLLSRLTIPVVTTLHTVLAEPSAEQRKVLLGVIEASAKVIVMADKARALLVGSYGVAPHKIEVIPTAFPMWPTARRTPPRAPTAWRRESDPDIRPALAQQGHGSHDRRDARDSAAVRRRGLCRAGRDPPQSGARRRRSLS